MAEDRVRAAETGSDGRPLLTFVLALCFSVAAFAIVAPLVLLTTDYTVLPDPLGRHKQNAESLLYLLTVIVFVPVAILLAARVANRLRSGIGRRAAEALVASLVIPLGFGLLLVRHSAGLPWGDGVKATLALGIVWTALASLAIVFGTRPAVADRLARWARPLTWLAAVATVAGALSVIDPGHIDAVPFAALLAVGALIVVLYLRVALPRIPRPWLIAGDVAALVLIAAAVPDMVILEPETLDIETAVRSSFAQFHQALFVGASSQVLDGKVLLVDTVSQYGIGSIYLVTAFFEIVPIGFLTLGLLEGILSAATFAASYGVLRMAGVGRLLAFGAMAVAVFAMAWGLLFPIGALLQHGAIRYALPMLLIVAVVAGARRPNSWRWLRWIALAVTGLSSVWALEAFLYMAGTIAGLVLIALPWQPAGGRLRWLGMVCFQVVASWIVVQILFALATLAASGSLPDWGLYISYLREFLAGDIGDITYDMPRWSPGLGVFAIYIASAIGMTVLSSGQRGFTATRRPAFVALAGLTGYGVALFSYFVNRSLDHILIYECLPVFLIVAIWLSLALSPASHLLPRARAWCLAAALGLAAIVVATTWQAATSRAPDSLLAYALPGGKTLGSGFDRIFDPPELKPGALAGERLIDRYFPDDESVAVITASDLDVEILARAGRANRLAITDAKEASWVPEPHLPGLEQAVDGLQAGDRMIVDRRALRAMPLVSVDPDRAFEGPGPIATEVELEQSQIRALALIAERFELRRLAGGRDGIYVVELVDRS